MIKQEFLKSGNRELIHTYSDIGKRILQVETGIIYDDAYDVKEYAYEEVNENVEA